MIPDQLNITVASLTRNRPRMLEALIESWVTLEVPEHTSVRFLVIENDDLPNSLGVVETLRARHPTIDLHYLLERRPGIPVARNTALDEARNAGADILCFVDDDEEVTPTWLRQLVATYRETGAVALGGPVVPRRPKGHLSALATRLFVAIEARSEARYRKIATRVASKGPSHVTVSTGNCLYDLALVGQGSLRFDESMVWTGGTDAKLSAEIVQSGGKLAWAPSAIVWETQPAERLTTSYIIQTARDREAVYLERKIRENRLFLLVILPLVLLRAAAYLVLVPASILNARAFYNTLLNTGCLLAVAYIAISKKPSLYLRTTGY